MKKITMYLTEQEVTLMQTVLSDNFKHLSMNASSHGEIIALHAINHILHKFGESKGWLANPVRKEDAKRRAAEFRKQKDEELTQLLSA